MKGFNRLWDGLQAQTITPTVEILAFNPSITGPGSWVTYAPTLHRLRGLTGVSVNPFSEFPIVQV